MKIFILVFILALAFTNFYVAKDEYDKGNFSSACVGAFSAGICTAGALYSFMALFMR